MRHRFILCIAIMSALLCYRPAVAGTWTVAYSASGESYSPCNGHFVNPGSSWLDSGPTSSDAEDVLYYEFGDLAQDTVYSTGTVGATLTWQPSAAGEKPPKKIWVSVNTSANAGSSYAVGSYGSYNTRHPSVQVYDGFGDPVVNGLSQGVHEVPVPVTGNLAVLPTYFLTASVAEDADVAPPNGGGIVAFTDFYASVSFTVSVESRPWIRKKKQKTPHTPIAQDPCDCGQPCGPQQGDPVDLSSLAENDDPPADLAVYNPNGPNVVFRRSYHSDLALDNLSSAGLSEGWTYNYDDSIRGPQVAGTWGPLILSYANQSEETLTPVLDPNTGQPTGVLTPPSGSDYFATGVPGPAAGQWLSLTITWKDQTRWLLTPIADQYRISTISNGLGQAVLLDWDSGSRLQTITDATSRTVLLSLSYGSDGYLSSVTDTYGRQVVFGFKNFHTNFYGDGLMAAGMSGNVVSRSFYPAKADAVSSEGRETAHFSATTGGEDDGDLYEDFPGSFAEGWDVRALATVSQIVSVGTNNPATRYAYGYRMIGAGALLNSTTVPNPSGAGTSTARVVYNVDGTVNSLVDGNGNQRIYTPLTGQTKIQVKDKNDVLTEQWTQSFDGTGQDTGTTDSFGHGDLTVYGDPANPKLPTQVTDKNGRTTQYWYDSFGNLTEVLSPRGITTQYTYDYQAFPLGRLMSVQEGTNFTTPKTPTSFTYYEPSGLLHTITTARPGSTNAFSGMASTGLTVTTTFTYDSLGNVLTVTSPGNDATLSGGTDQGSTITYNYVSDPGDAAHGIPAVSQGEAIGQPLTVSDSLGNTTHFRYGSRGLLVSEIDALGNETDYGDATPTHPGGYNLADQLQLVTLPATSQTGIGQGSVRNVYLYPGGPLLVRSVYDESDGLFRQTSQAYGNEGELLSMTATDGVKQVSYTYDAQGRLKTVADPNSNVTRYYYDPAGNLASVLYPGGDALQFPAYDGAGNVLKRIDGRGTETDYVYDDPEDQLTAIHYPGAPSLDVQYSYDPYGRTAAMTDATGSTAYGYDDSDVATGIVTTYAGLPGKTISYEFYRTAAARPCTRRPATSSTTTRATGGCKAFSTPLAS